MDAYYFDKIREYKKYSAMSNEEIYRIERLTDADDDDYVPGQRLLVRLDREKKSRERIIFRYLTYRALRYAPIPEHLQMLADDEKKKRAGVIDFPQLKELDKRQKTLLFNCDFIYTDCIVKAEIFSKGMYPTRLPVYKYKNRKLVFIIKDVFECVGNKKSPYLISGFKVAKNELKGFKILTESELTYA